MAAIPLYMTVAIDESNGIFEHPRDGQVRVTADLVTLGDTGEPRILDDYSPHDAGYGLRGLVACTYGPLVEDVMWRYEVYFSTSGLVVDLERAQAYVRTLQRISRGLAKLGNEWGPPESFPAYLMRVGKILKVREYGFPPPNGNDLWASGRRYRWLAARDIPSMINMRVADIRRPYIESEAVAA